MSTQSDAAKKHIEMLLNEACDWKPVPTEPWEAKRKERDIWYKEYKFHPDRKWRFDYAVPALLCAKPPSFLKEYMLSHSGAHYRDRRGHISAGQNGTCIRRWTQELAREEQCSHEPRVESMALCT